MPDARTEPFAEVVDLLTAFRLLRLRAEESLRESLVLEREICGMSPTPRPKQPQFTLIQGGRDGG